MQVINSLPSQEAKEEVYIQRHVQQLREERQITRKFKSDKEG